MRSVPDEFKQAKNLRLTRLIYLYSIKYDVASNSYLRYTNYGKEIEFGGYVYQPYAIKHESMVEDLSGQAASLTLKIANVNRNIQAINDAYGLIEKEVKIYTITQESLSNPQAYTSDTFYVVDAVINKQEATLRVSSVFDVMDVRVPRRYFFRAYCRFRLKDENCQYAGSQNDCDKTMQRCRELNNTRHFGAFPSIPVQKLLFQ
jgi:phage-related protein